MISRTFLRRSSRLPVVCSARLSLPRALPVQNPSRQLIPSQYVAFAPRRFYATETPRVENPEEEAAADAAKAAERTAPSSRTGQAEDSPLQKELEDKKREVINLKDMYLRQVADFRNLQDRTKRDVASARDFAIQSFAKDLVESIDNLDRALGTVPEEKLQENQNDEANRDLVALFNGLKMTETVLMNTLKKHGLERFDPSADAVKFNPNEHEALFMTPVPGLEDGTCISTQQKGFKLNGRVLRAAKVGVVKNPSPEATS